MDATKSSPRRLSCQIHRLALLLLVLGAGGASCPRMVEQYRLPVAPVFAHDATLDQVTLVINENSARVQSLSATGAKISSSEFPTLKASLAIDRPRRLRLLAEATALTGGEFDLGSNDEIFWFWVKRNTPPALYFCRHDQFDASASRNVVPIEPDWLVEALGIVTFDPADEHQGPFRVGRNRLEIRTIVRRSAGTLTKVRVVDASRGWVVAQHIYDATGQRLATALASGHRRDPLSQAILPRHIEIQWPMSQFNLTIDLGEVALNTVPTDNAQLWTKPVYEGWPDVDLATARVSVGPDGQLLISPGEAAPANLGVPAAETTREVRTPAPHQSGAVPTGDTDTSLSPLADPSGSTIARQAGFRSQPVIPPLPRAEQSRPRRVIPDYAAEPVIWR